ncbi:MAG: hypothetical protein NC399_08125 [Muribaculum sp.]|nr:hypothetical protein [Muribaculum sp.]
MTDEIRKKWFRRDNLIVLILAGILLFIIALPTKKEETAGSLQTDLAGGFGGTGVFAQETDPDAVRNADIQGADARNTAAQMGQSNVLNAQATGKTEDYAAAQEKKLAELISAIEGVGRVEVMLTFLSSEELVVEKDAPTVRSNTVERDSEGGNRTVSQFETGDSTVYRSSSGNSEPYVVKTLNPRVEGVVVVAEGAGGAVNSSIVQIAQALFGVEAHRVVVLPMGDAAGSAGSAAAGSRAAGNAADASAGSRTEGN